MPALDSVHTLALTIGGTSFYPYVKTGTLKVVEAEGGQIDTLSFDLEDTGWSTDPVEWKDDVVFSVDGTAYFGGYIVKITPTVSEALDQRTFAVSCESYATLFSRSPRIRLSFANSTPRTIVAALFSAAGITGYDLTTHVPASPTLDLFTANGILLNEALDKLTAAAGAAAGVDWVWRTDAAKSLWLGPATSDVAPFAIADIETANYTTTFPPNAHPSVSRDATQIRNRITVLGGVNSASEATDTFTGDGTTTLFKLSHQPVRRIVDLTVDGTLKRYGWDWVDDFGATVDILVNFESGTLRFPDASPPAVSAAISVTYLYDVSISTVRSSAASQTYYGRWFDYEHEDRSITSQAEAELAGDAFLAAYAYGAVTGQFVVERFGLRAGQLVTIEYPLLNVSGTYVLRQVTCELLKGEIFRLTAQYGGLYLKLSRLLGGKANQSAYYSPSVPYQNNSVNNSNVTGFDGVGDGNFQEP